MKGTRRELLAAVLASGPANAATADAPLVVPVHHVVDSLAKWRPGQVDGFWSGMWPEAVRDFRWCGIRLQGTAGSGEVVRPPERQPLITGLDAGALNVVITDQIPSVWDNGKALSGVTMRYRGYHVSMISLYNAHAHQIPLLSVNTCVHELLHALLQDIYETNPKGASGQAREFRIDLYATRLWLFHDGDAVRKAAEAYVARLRADYFPRT